MTNQELRFAYENQELPTDARRQISQDIDQTGGNLDSFWANYCPEDDGNGWVRGEAEEAWEDLPRG